MVKGHSFILICQMAAVVRYALAEVCTVPLLLVDVGFYRTNVLIVQSAVSK